MKKSSKKAVAIVASWLGLMASAEAAPGEAVGNLASESREDASQAREEWHSVIAQVAAYRGGLKAMMADVKLGPRAKEAEAKIDSLVKRSEQLVAANRFAEALNIANEANRLIVEAIVRLRSGDTVVVSLTFDSPMEEYAYEQRRFESNEVMVAMNVDEGRAGEPSKRKVVEDNLGEGRRLRAQAEKSAQIGKYPEAVRVMETASGKLIKALQAMGVPVF